MLLVSLKINGPGNGPQTFSKYECIAKGFSFCQKDECLEKDILVREVCMFRDIFHRVLFSSKDEWLEKGHLNSFKDE